MARVWFAKGATQARKIMQGLQGRGNAVESVRTARHYEQSLARVADWQKAEHKAGREGGDLRTLTVEQAERFLAERSESVRQSQLNMDRQAIECMMRHSTGLLAADERLSIVRSELDDALGSRAYTADQVHIVAERQQEPNALATHIAHAAGLRAHELYTLRPAHERPADGRPARDDKFSVRDGECYTVIGKGGLCREVLLPRGLADRLENTRLAEPERINDRGVFYQRAYAIPGGNRWSASFTRASQRGLGWSNGAHGVRHSYAQERMGELQRNGLAYRDALETVSQEMGHFRPAITEVYLR